MPAETGELLCARCGREVRKNRESYELLERMHYLCFHYEFEHWADPDQSCGAGCPSTAFTEGPDWGFYWVRHPDAPFTVLIRMSTTYLHPEADDLESLQNLARRQAPGDGVMRAFKAQLRRAIQDPSRLPGDELGRHVDFDDGSTEAFLHRLWRDLYGDEPPLLPQRHDNTRRR